MIPTDYAVAIQQLFDPSGTRVGHADSGEDLDEREPDCDDWNAALVVVQGESRVDGYVVASPIETCVSS